MEIAVNGITLYYEVLGSGSPLLMIHGNGEDHTIFAEAAEILKNYFTVYLIDSRGHGQSSPVSQYHYSDMADDLKAFITQLGLTDVTYYGFSDGGILGLLLASQTDLCKQYILSGTNFSPNGVKPSLGLMLRVMNLFKKDPLFTLMLTEPNISAEELAAVHAPVNQLAGTKDLIREAHTKKLQNMIPGSTLELLPGRTHGSYIVHSTEIAELILRYSGKAGLQE